ncbi:MAG: hypothetical protein WCF54_02875 [Terracidiphilus sp.]
MNRFIALLIATTLLFAGPAVFAQTMNSNSTGILQGTVLDSSGVVIQSFILIHSDRAGNPISKEVTQKRQTGEFKIQLKPGLYDLFICSPGYVPIAELVEIRSGMKTERNVKLQLDKEYYTITSID